MEPITDVLSLRKQNMFYIQRTLIEKIVLIGWQTITILRHEHLQARLLDCDLCQGIVKRYDITIP